MTPFFSIITPTLQRDSLRRTCASVDAQTFTGWEHLVCVDGRDVNADLARDTFHDSRFLFFTDVTHNFGNHQRWFVWPFAMGRYLLHLDDDNYLADPNVLQDIHDALIEAGSPDWASFPILRFGGKFYDDIPRSCHADTMNILVKREFGRWPNRDEYTCDGIWIDALRENISLTFKGFPDFRPIGIMDRQGKGER